MSGRGRGVRLAPDGSPTVQVPILMSLREREALDSYLAGLPPEERLPRAEWIRRAITDAREAGETFSQ